MIENIKSDITKRFSVVCDKLIADGLFKNKSDFARKVGLSPQNLNSILNGERNVSIFSLNELIENANINPYWLLLGKGDMLVENSNLSMSDSSIGGSVIQGSHNTNAKNVNGNFIGNKGSINVTKSPEQIKNDDYETLKSENAELREELARVKGELGATERMLEKMFNKKQ